MIEIAPDTWVDPDEIAAMYPEYGYGVLIIVLRSGERLVPTGTTDELRELSAKIRAWQDV